MAVLYLLSKFAKNAFCLVNILQFQKHQVFTFINVRNMQNGQQISGKSRLRQRLFYD